MGWALLWAMGTVWGFLGLTATAALEEKRLWWVALWLGPLAFLLLGPLSLRNRNAAPAVGLLRTSRRFVRSQLSFFRDTTRSLLVMLTMVATAAVFNATSAPLPERFTSQSAVAITAPQPAIDSPAPESPVTAVQPVPVPPALLSGPNSARPEPLDLSSWDSVPPPIQAGGRFSATDRDFHYFGPWCRQAVEAHQQGDYARAIESYRQALRSGESKEIARNNLAWILATCPNDALRNGRQAVELVEAMVQAAGTPFRFRWNQYGTVAAAYAASGDFEEAARWQRYSVMTSPGEHRAQQEARLRLYSGGESFQESTPENVVMGPLPTASVVTAR